MKDCRLVKTSLAIVLTAMVLVIAGAGCGGKDGGGGEMLASADSLIPASSFEDWVTFADAVAVVEATGEAEILPARDEDGGSGEGMIGRTVTVRLVELLWSRPGAAARPPEQFTFTTAGWVYDREGRRPISFNGGAHIEVGQSYVVPLVDYDAATWSFPEDTGWGPLDMGATYRYHDGAVRFEEGQRTQELVQGIEGLRGAEVARALAEAKPLAEDERRAHLESVARELGVDPRPR